MAAYLIDFENVKSDGIKGILQLSEEDTVVIFYSHNADTLTFETMDMIFAAKAKVRKYKIVRVGKNSLDFQLSTYLGWLIRDGKDSNFFIISKDNGFQHVMEFWKKSFGFEGYVFCCPTIGDAYMKLKRFENISARERQKAMEEEARAELTQAFETEAEEEAETAFAELETEVSQEERVFVESDDEVDGFVGYRSDRQRTTRTEQNRPDSVEKQSESTNNPTQEAKPAVRQDARQDDRRQHEKQQDGHRSDSQTRERKDRNAGSERRGQEHEHENRQSRRERFEHRKEQEGNENQTEANVQMNRQTEAAPVLNEQSAAVQHEDVRVISQDEFMTAVVHDDGPKEPAVPKTIHQERRTVVDSQLAAAIAAAVPDDGFRVTAVESSATVHAVAEPETPTAPESGNAKEVLETVKAEESVKEQPAESRSRRSHHRKRSSSSAAQSESSTVSAVEEPVKENKSAESSAKKKEAASAKKTSAKKKAQPVAEEKAETAVKPKARTKKPAAKKAAEEPSTVEKSAEPVKTEMKTEEQPTPKKASKPRGKKAAPAKESVTAPAETAAVPEVKQTRRQGRRPKPKTSEAAEFMTE